VTTLLDITSIGQGLLPIAVIGSVIAPADSFAVVSPRSVVGSQALKRI
jgi:hypothetical protein